MNFLKIIFFLQRWSNGITWITLYVMSLPLVSQAKHLKICLGLSRVNSLHSTCGIKLLRGAHFGSYHLRAHLIIFSDCLDEFWIIRTNIESTNISSSNVFSIYPQDKRLWWKFGMLRFHYPMKMKIIFLHTLLFVSHKHNKVKNFCILNVSIKYILSTERFDFPLWIMEGSLRR